jgi:hypothetical protein
LALPGPLLALTYFAPLFDYPAISVSFLPFPSCTSISFQPMVEVDH